MINIPKGTKDVLPSESYKWHYIENVAKEVASTFGIREIRTPVFEHTEVFLRGVGDTTDIVNKEMYTFLDKGERSITLKPEGTAGVCRSFIENGLANNPQPTKMFYITPVFRYERPQAGRLREHHQFGVEIYGSPEPSVDAEIILVAKSIFDKLGITNLELNLNSIGCKHCRAQYNKALKEYLKGNLESMCGTCKERYEKNPLRILDCKENSCLEIKKNAPIILDYLCDDCKNHFNKLQELLKSVDVEFKINPMIVRGLDYYTRTVFEFVSTTIGAKGTVCGGGRYDGLTESLGGKSVQSAGFGMGLERLILQLESMGIEIPNTERTKVLIVNADENSYFECFKLASELRKNDISCDLDHIKRGLKAQFKFANKLDVDYVVTIGETEISEKSANVKNMKTGTEERIKFENIMEHFKKLFQEKR